MGTKNVNDFKLILMQAFSGLTLATLIVLGEQNVNTTIFFHVDLFDLGLKVTQLIKSQSQGKQNESSGTCLIFSVRIHPLSEIGYFKPKFLLILRVTQNMKCYILHCVK